MQITNRFDKACCVCRVWVKQGEGFASNLRGGKWQTYCPQHAPEQIQARAVVSTERKLDRDGWITMPYEKGNLPLVQAMPGAQWHGRSDCKCGCGGVRKQWRVSLADSDRIRVLEIADQLQLTVDPILRTLEQVDHATLPAGLYAFQKTGVNWLSRKDRALLGDEMGLGKTIQALLSLAKDDRVLVVCPNTLKFNWEAEARKWRPEFEVRVLSAKDRQTGGFPIPKPGQIVIVNYEILPTWLAFDPKDTNAVSKLPKGVEKLKGLTLIADEAHFVSNYKSQRSRKITNLGNLVSRVWFLTGTALTTSPSNLWSVLGAAGLQQEAFGSFSNFCRLFHAQKKSRWGGIAWGSPDASVPERLRRVMLRRTMDEVFADMPKLIYQDIEVNDIPASLKTQLDAIWDEQGDILEVDGALPDFQEFSKIKNQLAIAKIPSLIEMIEEHEAQNVPLVVFSDHIAPVDACGARPGWGVIKGDTKPIDRQAVVDAFQAGQLKGVACTITAGGTGLNLHRANKIIFCDLNWTPANNAQAAARIRRIGQASKTLQVARLVTRHPLERHIHNLIAEKIALFDGAIDATVTPAAPAAPNGPQVAVKGETDAEYQARLAAILKAAQELEEQNKAKAEAEKVAKAKAKADGMLASERAKNGRVEKPITPQRADQIRGAIRYLASVCDGAVSLDGMGFNKPDAMRGRILSLAGLQTENELRAAEYVIWKYRGQIESRFPLVFV